MGLDEVGDSLGVSWKGVGFIEGVEAAATDDLLRFGGMVNECRVDLFRSGGQMVCREWIAL